MKKLLAVLTIFPLLTSSFAGKGQDVHFSQFYETTILRNPALTAIFSGDYKVAVNYRSQWSSISQPFTTGQLSFESRIPVNSESNDFFSCGLLANYDKAGSVDLKSISIYPAIGFNKSLGDANNSFLSVGFTGGYIQRSFDLTKAQVNSQYQNGVFNPDNSTGENLNNTKIQHWDVGAGVNFSSGGGAYNNISYFLGFSGYHFTKPKRSFYNDKQVRLETRWNANAGMTYRIDDNYGLLLQGNYMVQGSYQEIMAGGLLNWKKTGERQDDPELVLYLGAFYRLNDAIVPVVKVDYMRYSIGFSYDLNISKLRAASNLRGGYELSVVKTGLFKDPKWERSRTVCPHAFF